MILDKRSQAYPYSILNALLEVHKGNYTKLEFSKNQKLHDADN